MSTNKEALHKAINEADLTGKIRASLDTPGLKEHNLSLHNITLTQVAAQDGRVCVKWDNQITHSPDNNGKLITVIQPVCKLYDDGSTN